MQKVAERVMHLRNAPTLKSGGYSYRVTSTPGKAGEESQMFRGDATPASA